MVGVGHEQLDSGQVLVTGNGGGMSRRVRRLERDEAEKGRCWRVVHPFKGDRQGQRGLSRILIAIWRE